MKSFKVIDMKIIQQQNFIVPEVKDGVIINMEYGDNPWIIEIVTDGDLATILEKLKGQHVEMMVTITRPSNAPAKFLGRLMDINQMDDMISVIFKGSIIVQGPNYAEDLLEFLVKERYEGKALVDEFNSRMESKEDFRKEDEE
ncbi:MAG: YwpF family protein [Jeotgalicoccus sp.]